MCRRYAVPALSAKAGIRSCGRSAFGARKWPSVSAGIWRRSCVIVVTAAVPVLAFVVVFSVPMAASAMSAMHQSVPETHASWLLVLWEKTWVPQSSRKPDIKGMHARFRSSGLKQRGGRCHPWRNALLLAALVTVAMGIEVPWLVPFMRMMGSGLFDRSGGRCALVAVAVRIQVSRNVTLVGMMRTGLLGGLVGHGSSSRLMDYNLGQFPPRRE